MRPALRTVLAAAALTACAAASVGAAEPAAPADLQQGIAALAGWLRASGAGELAMTRPPVAVARPDGEAVRLSGLTWRTPHATVGFGDVEIVRTDAGKGLWRLAGPLPPQVTVDLPGQPTTVVTAGRSSFEIVLDPRSGAVSRTTLEAGEIAAAMEPVARLRLAAASLTSEVSQGPDGKAVATSGYRLDGLVVGTAPATAGAPAEEILRVRSLVGGLTVGGVDWARFLELQALLAANPDPAAAGPEVAGRLQTLATQPDPVADSVEFRFGVEEAWAGEALGGPASLAKGSVRLAVSGLAGDSVSAGIRYRHDGLAVPGGEAVPEAAGLEVAVERLPGRQLAGLLESDLDIGASLAALLQDAGTTARIDRAHLTMGASSADLEARVRASAAAPDGFAGQATLTVVNLERAVAGLGGLVGDQLAALQLAAALGQRTEDGGRVTHRWAFTRDEAGRSTLNGNDVSALLADGMARLEPAPDGDAAETPAASGTGLTPGFVAARLEEFGLAATVSDDGTDAPTISAELTDALEGQTLEVEFFDCEPGGACGSCMLYLGVEPDRQVPLAEVNQWNRGERWARAYRDDDGALWIELDIAGDEATAGQVDALIAQFLAAAERLVTELAAAR